MSPEKIIEEEIQKYGEWVEMLPDHQLAAFMVPVLANRCFKAEEMVKYLKKRVDGYEIKKETGHGTD